MVQSRCWFVCAVGFGCPSPLSSLHRINRKKKKKHLNREQEQRASPVWPLCPVGRRLVDQSAEMSGHRRTVPTGYGLLLLLRIYASLRAPGAAPMAVRLCAGAGCAPLPPESGLPAVTPPARRLAHRQAKLGWPSSSTPPASPIDPSTDRR